MAVTAWETENPRRTLPKAVRRVAGRIILYYTSAIFFLGLTVSSNDPMLQLPQNKNPRYPGGFVIMSRRAGIPIVPDIINFVMIVAAFSVATADLYVTVFSLATFLSQSRCLSSIACIGFMGPSTSRHAQIMQKPSRWNVPYIALFVSITPWAIAFLNLSLNDIPENVNLFQMMSDSARYIHFYLE